MLIESEKLKAKLNDGLRWCSAKQRLTGAIYYEGFFDGLMFVLEHTEALEDPEGKDNGN